MKRTGKRPTIKDIARLAGVSVGTVSAIINYEHKAENGSSSRVRECTVAKVMDAIDKLGYTVNRKAASLRSGRSYTIAVIVPDIANSFFANIAASIWQEAYKSGYTVLFLSSGENPDRLLEMIDSSVCEGVDGIILSPSEDSEKALVRALELGIPIVLLDRQSKAFPDMVSITLNNEEASSMAVDYLVSKGKKKIEMLCFDTRISSLEQRKDGFLACLSRHKLSEYGSITQIDYDCSVQELIEILKKQLERGIEGMVFASNKCSVLGLKALKELGCRIPEDMEVVGFDENDIFDFNVPAIPYVTQSTTDFGVRSFSALMKMLRSESVQSEILKPIICNI